MMSQKKVIFWISDTDKILKGEKPEHGIGGANVQLAFWAHTFAKQEYKSYALTRTFSESGKNYELVNFIWHPVIRYVGFILNYFTAFFILIIIRPNLLVSRAKVPELKYLKKLSSFFDFKMVHMLAHDDDVMPNENGQKTKFQIALQTVDYVIAQNTLQKELYNQHFRNADIPIIPNIWESKIGNSLNGDKLYDFIWVANFRKIKRPLWFIVMAEAMPEFSFAMVGSAFDANLYRECEHKIASLKNIQLLGYKSLFEVNQLVFQSRALVCTSVMEGFPNTFLQALSVNVPLISTVDPSGIIQQYKLGAFCNDINNLITKANLILKDEIEYKKLKENIADYFYKQHAPDNNFQVFKNYLEL